MARRQPVDTLPPFPAEQRVERPGKRQAPHPRAASCRPAARAAIRRARRAAPRPKGRPGPARRTGQAARRRSAAAGLAPRQQVEPMLADLEQADLDRGDRPGCRGRRKAGRRPAGGRARRAPRRWRYRTGLRYPTDAVGEQGLDHRRVDRRRGQDARAGGCAADFRHRQPFLPRQRRGRVEPEAASADAEPVAAVAAAPLRQPVGKGERDAAAERSRPWPVARLSARAASSASHLFARPRAACARLPLSLRQRRNLISRSASGPPSPRSEISTAASAAVGAQPRASASISIWASRGGSGSAAIARPWPVGRPSSPIAPRLSRRRRPRRARRPAAGRASAGGAVGDAPERAVEQQRGQIGFQYLGGSARQALGRRFLPQAIDASRRLASGASGPA